MSDLPMVQEKFEGEIKDKYDLRLQNLFYYLFYMEGENNE